MLYRFLILLGLPVYIVFAQYAVASSSDIQQPISIEADRAELDQQKQTSTYNGNVVLHQGSIEIKADTIIVFAQNGKVHRITAEGDPVNYRQQREDKNEIHGVSQRVEYKTEPKLLLLLGKAELWQGNSHFSGERIEYDPAHEKVIATGGIEGDSEGKGRVQIILQPDTPSQNDDGSPSNVSPKDKP